MLVATNRSIQPNECLKGVALRRGSWDDYVRRGMGRISAIVRQDLDSAFRPRCLNKLLAPPI